MSSAQAKMGLGLGVSGAWRTERTMLVESESQVDFDSVLGSSLFYRLGQFRFFYEHSRYSRQSASGNLSVKQETAQNQLGLRYGLLDSKWGSPFFGLTAGFGQHKITTVLAAEASELKSNSFFLWGAEVGYEVSLWRGLFADLALRLSYPQNQDVATQVQFQVGYIWHFY